MNANEREKELYSMDIQEFADWVEEYHGDMLSEVTAGRLRQQQAEIEALKLGDRQWKHAFDLAKIEIAELKAIVAAKNTSQECVAKTQNNRHDLTDEEIEEVATINLGHSMGLLNWMGFARAILRKAQE